MSQPWFPLIEQTSASDIRHGTVQGGGKLKERIVTPDDELRRFQDLITPGDMPAEVHIHR